MIEVAAGICLALLVRAAVAVAATRYIRRHFLEGTVLPWYWALAIAFGGMRY
jgi:hypothetical protein